MMKCANEYWRQPTFVLVDFFNFGPVIKSVDIFNKVQDPTGRKNVTTTILDNGLPSRRVSGSDRNAPVSNIPLAVAVGRLIRYYLN